MKEKTPSICKIVVKSKKEMIFISRTAYKVANIFVIQVDHIE